jgi:hypothetical protein
LFFHKAFKGSKLQLHVAGHLTESLAEHIPQNPNIHLHGTLTNARLAEMLEKCSLCWIHQNISTGSLTKIPELMMSGVPVLLNSDAARNFYNVEGIKVYEHDEDCTEKIKLELPIPSAPEKPVVHEKILIQTKKNLLA